MDLEKEYNKLYEQWLKEFENVNLTPLSEENFKDYKRIFKDINDYPLNQKEEIKSQLLDSYKKNIDYLFKDFLRIREVKLINAALSLKEIDLKVVIESEKLFYQNLVSAIKGFQKLKAFTLYEEFEKPLEEQDQKILQIEEESKVEQLKQIIKEHSSQTKEVVEEQQEIEYNYTLVRFIKKAPPLVGIDLINYGPFEENDVANLPYKNAKILIYEKFAKKIEIP
ncbi:MAG: hypothetical protein ACFE85_03750 [Candidatus Hodarchaeota archaeon]